MSNQAIIENSLFEVDNARFAKIEKDALDFGKLYYGDGIIQDDIFVVAGNYLKQNGETLEFIRLPIKDDDLCGLTYIKKGKVFLFINSNLPMEKQIFACSHELFHIYCYVRDMNHELYQNGSLLLSKNMDYTINSREDREANAFAATLLVPQNKLHEKMKIFGIPSSEISLEDIVKLMDIFAVPYKTMLLRLYECKCISKKKVLEFLSIPDRDENEGVLKLIMELGYGKRWQERTPQDIQFGSLLSLMSESGQNEFVESERLAEDRETIENIKKAFDEGGTVR